MTEIIETPDLFGQIDAFGEISENDHDFLMLIPVWENPSTRQPGRGKHVRVYDTASNNLLGYIPESLYTDIVSCYFHDIAALSDYDNYFTHTDTKDTYDVFVAYQCAGFGYSKTPIMGPGMGLCRDMIMPASSFAVLSKGTNTGPLPDIISPQDEEYSWVMDSYGKRLGLVAPWHSFAVVPENIGESKLISTDAPDGPHVFSTPSANSVEWLAKTTLMRAEAFSVPYLGEVFPCHESASNYDLVTYDENAEEYDED